MYSALKNDEFEVYYQPVFDAKTKRSYLQKHWYDGYTLSMGSLRRMYLFPLWKKQGLL